jgi:hypothetical protein
LVANFGHEAVAVGTCYHKKSGKAHHYVKPQRRAHISITGKACLELFIIWYRDRGALLMGPNMRMIAF